MKTFCAGELKFDKRLDLATHLYLDAFQKTFHIRRDLPVTHGKDGEFYVENGDGMEIRINQPPRTQPSHECPWAPTRDGEGLAWNERTRLSNPIEWLSYVIQNFTEPQGFRLNGDLYYTSDTHDGIDVIEVRDNKISILVDSKTSAASDIGLLGDSFIGKENEIVHKIGK